MVNMLLRCVKHLRQVPEIVVLNQNKIRINCVIQRYNSPFVILARNMLLMPSIEEHKKSKVTLHAKMQYIERNMLPNGWIKKGAIENVLSDIKSADDIHSSHALLLLQWCNTVMDCLPLERLRLAEYLWSHLLICNIRMDSSHYNALLQIYLQNDHDFSPVELLTEMNSKGIQPDCITYQRCIQHYCTKGNILQALELVKYMRELHFPINIAIYNSLILGYSQLGDLKSIFKISNNLKEDKIKPTAEMYTAVMCAYANRNDITGIKEQIYICHLNNIHLSNVNILNVIYTLAKNNYMQHIDTMCRYLKKLSLISSNEIDLILKLVYINQIDTVVNILSHIGHVKILPLILRNLVYCSTEIDKIVYTCTLFENEKMFKCSLLSALYYSFFKDDDHLCLPLLRACKLHYTIKPHYFWPLLIKKANVYDFKGILNILKIMKSEFNASPCVNTITNYVLPFSFGKVFYLRQVLMQYGVCETTVNNAYVLSYLKKRKTKNALYYMKYYPGYYSYKVMEHDLRSALIATNDVNSFISISSILATNTCADLETSVDDKASTTAVLVPMDKILIDFMVNNPLYKTYLVKIIIELGKTDISISPETVNRLRLCIEEYASEDVADALANVSNKRV